MQVCDCWHLVQLRACRAVGVAMRSVRRCCRCAAGASHTAGHVPPGGSWCLGMVMQGLGRGDGGVGGKCPSAGGRVAAAWTGVGRAWGSWINYIVPFSGDGEPRIVAGRLQRAMGRRAPHRAASENAVAHFRHTCNPSPAAYHRVAHSGIPPPLPSLS